MSVLEKNQSGGQVNACGFVIGERRHSSAGNLYELLSFDGDHHVYIRRVGIVGQEGRELWDHDVKYRWMCSQWDCIPLVGESTHDYPCFGLFMPGWRTVQ